MINFQSIQKPFEDIHPITLIKGQGNDITLNPKDHRKKALKQGLSQVHSILMSLSQCCDADDERTRINLVSIRETSAQILAKINPHPKVKTELLEDVKALNKSLPYEVTKVTLNTIKQNLVDVLHKTDSLQTLYKAIDKAFDIFAIQQKTLMPNVTKAHDLFPQVFVKCQKLRHKIDAYDIHLSPSKDAEASIVHRSEGAITKYFIEGVLEQSNRKEHDKKARYVALTTEWNKFYDRMNEMITYMKAIDTIKITVSDLSEFKLKLEKLNQKISGLQKSNHEHELYLEQEFDPKLKNSKQPGKSPILPRQSETIQTDLNQCEQELQSLSTVFNELSLTTKQTLTKLKTNQNETPDILLRELPPDISELYAETEKKSVTLFAELEKEITVSFDNLQLAFKKTHLEFNLLNQTSKFISDLTHSLASHEELAKTLRDARKTKKLSSDYASVHNSKSAVWDALCLQIKELSDRYTEIMGKLEALAKSKDEGESKQAPTYRIGKDQYSSTEDTGESKMRPENDVYKDAKLEMGHQERVKKMAAKIAQVWSVKLPSLSRIAATELNRGAKALENKEAYPNNFDEAFVSETRFILADKTTSMLPKMLTTWTVTSEEKPATHYQSPFDAV